MGVCVEGGKCGAREVGGGEGEFRGIYRERKKQGEKREHKRER